MASKNFDDELEDILRVLENDHRSGGAQNKVIDNHKVMEKHQVKWNQIA